MFSYVCALCVCVHVELSDGRKCERKQCILAVPSVGFHPLCVYVCMCVVCTDVFGRPLPLPAVVLVAATLAFLTAGSEGVMWSVHAFACLVTCPTLTDCGGFWCRVFVCLGLWGLYNFCSTPSAGLGRSRGAGGGGGGGGGRGRRGPNIKGVGDLPKPVRSS